jgi:cell wall-associated NlpC family hydrolase
MNNKHYFMANYRRITLFFLILIFAQRVFSQERSSAVIIDTLNVKPDSTKIFPIILLENGDSAVSYAKKFMGTHYKYAGNTPETGFDCSGFVNYVLKNFNITLPRSSKDFDKIGTAVSTDSCLPGDIVLFSRTLKNKTITGHVGIVIENNGNSFQFIHATTRKGIIIDDFKKSIYFFERFRGIRRVLKTEKTI